MIPGTGTVTRPQRWATVPTILASGLALLASCAPAALAAPSCPPNVRGAARQAAALARGQAGVEGHGAVARHALRRIARDPALLGALRAGRIAAAREEAQRIIFGHSIDRTGFINHVVRLRVVSPTHRILVNPNTENDSIPGPSVTLRRRDGRPLGLLSISIQDIGGLARYVHDVFHAEMVARGGIHAVATIPVGARPLPADGCVRLRGRRYGAFGYRQLTFDGVPLRAWVLVAR